MYAAVSNTLTIITTIWSGNAKYFMFGAGMILNFLTLLRMLNTQVIKASAHAPYAMYATSFESSFHLSSNF